MEHGLHDSQDRARGEGQEAQGGRPRARSCSTPSAACSARAASASSASVTGTNSFEFVNRGDHTQIATFENRPITHNYAGNLADVCPVGALLSHDFRFKMRVWFLERHGLGLPRLLHRLQHLRRPPRRRGAAPAPAPQRRGQQVLDVRRGPHGVQGDRPRHAAWPRRGCAATPARRAGPLTAALDARGTRAAGRRARPPPSWPRRRPPTRTSTRSALLADAVGGMLDFRVGNPQDRLQRARGRRPPARRPQPQHPGLPRPRPRPVGRGRDPRRPAAPASVKALLLQGPELLRLPEAADAVAKVPFVAVMATHDGPELDRAHVVLPAAMWAEVDGTFTNYQRRVQRIRRAVAAPGEAAPRWEMAAGLLRRLGAHPRRHLRPRGLRAGLARTVPDYAGLDYAASAPPAARCRSDGPAPQEAQGLMAWRRASSPSTATPKPGIYPILHRDGHHLQEHGEDAVRPAGRHHPVPRAEARHLPALPRHPHPHPAHGRHAQVRGLLHVRHGVPRGVHLHRVRRAPRAPHREVPHPLRDRPPALRLLRLLRGRLPGGGDHHEPRERPRGHHARGADHRPRPAHGPRQARASTAPATGPRTTTCAARCASPPSSG